MESQSLQGITYRFSCHNMKVKSNSLKDDDDDDDDDDDVVSNQRRKIKLKVIAKTFEKSSK